MKRLQKWKASWKAAVFGLCVIAIALCAGTYVAVAQDAKVKLVASSNVAERGDEVSVTIDLKGNSGIWGLKYKVDYDHDALTLKKVENGTVFEDEEMILPSDLTQDRLVFVASGEQLVNHNSNGQVAKLVFTVKKNTKFSKYPISVELTQAIDVDGTDVAIKAEDGVIEVKECKHQGPGMTANGFCSKTGKKIYYENGTIADRSGVVNLKNYDGRWYYLIHGVLQERETVAHNPNGWWYINSQGRVGFSYTGFASNTNGIWYCTNGRVDFTAQGFRQGMYQGKLRWAYVVNSKVQATEAVRKKGNELWYIGPDGFVNNTATTVAIGENGMWYVKNGKVDLTYNGLASNSSGTWKITNGKVTLKDNGVKLVNGKWYNFVNSKLTPGPTVAKNANGWWYINKKGMVDFSFSGLAKDKRGVWKITKGKVTGKDNGVILVGGKWYYFINSKLTVGPTVAKNANGWWYIDKKGKVDFTYTGVASNKHGTWYIKRGKVQFGYSGKYTSGKTTYTIKAGKVVSKTTKK